MTARFLIGDVFQRMAELPDGAYDLIVTSPPFLALRSYLPDDHPDKAKEIGSEATPAEFLDTMLALTAEWGRLLTPHGSIAIEIGDTYSGSGGAGGDYGADGLREGQPTWTSPAARTAASSSHRDSDSDVATSAPRTSRRSSPLRTDEQSRRGVDARNRGNTSRGTATRQRDNPGAWPQAKSLAMIPELYAASLAYGRNLLTGAESPAGRWRVRNFKPWIRSNPPVGALGDKERPATSYITVACRADDRYFDLDAVRTAHADHPRQRSGKIDNLASANRDPSRGDAGQDFYNTGNPAGAPPLDWWHHVDAIIDHEIDQRAGKTGQGGGPGPARATKLHGGGEGNGVVPKEATTVGARGVHIRRALETAGILTTHDAYDISPRGYSGMSGPTTRLVPCGPHDGGLRTTSRGCPVHGDRAAPPHMAPRDGRADDPPSRTQRTDDRPARVQPDGSAATDPPSEPTTEAPSSDSPHRQCAPAASQRDSGSSRTDPAPSTSPAGTPSSGTTGRTAHISASPSSTVPGPDTPESSTAEACPDGDTPETADRSARTSSPPSAEACTCSYHHAVKNEESTSHYAVWPPELVQRLINEMCPRRVCTTCGQPSRRVTETTQADTGRRTNGQKNIGRKAETATDYPTRTEARVTTLGWSDCGHGTWRPGRILDPFVGSGTTLAVATGMARHADGIDLDPSNAHLARDRVGMFLEVIDQPAQETA